MYLPSEDSYLLAEQVSNFLEKFKKKNLKILDTRKIYLKSDFQGDQESKNNKNLRILDMGTGSCIQALACKKAGFNDVTCVDLDSQALAQAKRLGFKSLKSNLFSKLKKKFDLIIFNPPYLPENKYDKQKDTTGGKRGDETILKFLSQASSHLTKDGKILLLVSSLTPKEKISSLIKKLKFKSQVLSSKKLFFEQLEVWLISFNLLAL